MRRIKYAVAASLDGFIAGPNGEIDWITMDPEFDFKAFFSRFDTVLIGRRTFQAMADAGSATMPGMKTFVFSRTLRQAEYPQVSVVSGDAEKIVRALRTETGRDIWLFGGGSLFGSLASEGLVDSVEVAVVPVLLGRGTPLFSGWDARIALKLTRHTVHGTGVVSLEYAVKSDSHSHH